MNTLVPAALTRPASRALSTLRRLPRGRARLAFIGLLLVCAAAGILATAQSGTTASTAMPPGPAPIAPAQAGTPAAPPALAPSTPAPAATTTITLHRGNTLWALARHYRTTVAELQQLNQLGTATLIRAGAALRVPATPPARPTTARPVRPAPAKAHQATAARAHHASTAPDEPAIRQTATTIFGAQYTCAADIISRESGWNPRATNPHSGAYGLAQALPGSKMARSGPNWRTDATTQLAWMRAYTDARYGGACNAWKFWQTHAWY